MCTGVGLLRINAFNQMTNKNLPTAQGAISELTGHEKFVGCFWSSNLHLQFDCYVVKKELFIFNYLKPHPYLYQTTLY